jgi:peroxygenase
MPKSHDLPLKNDSTIPEIEGLAVTSIPYVPVTEQRKPFINTSSQPSLHHAGKIILMSTPTTPDSHQTGAARANLAPSSETPHGTTKNNWAGQHSNKTVLQQHCDFFEASPGIITPLSTFLGFRALGYNLFLCALAVFIIHANFSYPTSPSWIPDPWFRIYLDKIHRDKHGSDTGTYDNEGRYVPQKFEDIFMKYAQGRDYLTVWDVKDVITGQRCIADPIGWGGALFECKLCSMM